MQTTETHKPKKHVTTKISFISFCPIKTTIVKWFYNMKSIQILFSSFCTFKTIYNKIFTNIECEDQQMTHG